jgi:beta-glucosidase
MSGFHEVGGVPVSGSHALLTETLREQWGFEGVVISDWGSVGELARHGYAEDWCDAAGKGINAGVDVDMAAEAYLRHLEDLLDRGVVSMARVDEACLRVLELKHRLGLFENPYTDLSLADEVQFTPSAQAKVLDLARKSIVLLRNNGVLPIANDVKTLGVFGPLHDNAHEMLGSWCLDGQDKDVVTVLEGIKSEFRPQRLVHSDLVDEAMFMARRCDVAIVVVGEHHHRSGENNCITRLDLPDGQTEFLAAIKRMGVPVVAVVLAGRPLALPHALADVDAIVYAWHPGTLGGTAIAEILSGKVNPSGKSPVTFPRTVGQVPIYYNHKPTGRPIDPNRRGWSRYVDEKDAPLFEFGFGLSYTTFSYSDMQVTPHGDGFEVSARVTNTGPVEGEEVVQLYLRDQASSMTRPVKELKGFERILLASGESKVVSFTLSGHDLGFYGPDEKWITEPGSFVFWIGPNSREGLSEAATLPVASAPPS